MRGRKCSLLTMLFFAAFFVLTAGFTAKAEGDGTGDKYNITFVTNYNGSFADGSYEQTITVDSGSAIGELAFTDPSDKSNYLIFDGWYADSNYETPIENIEAYVPSGDEKNISIY